MGLALAREAFVRTGADCYPNATCTRGFVCIQGAWVRWPGIRQLADRLYALVSK